MTAELVLMNRAAAVLAADSAATLPGRVGVKTYNSASKIFPVSKHPPIGAMVFGDAELLQVPWETLVGMYRRHLAEVTGPPTETIGDVASGFFDWVNQASLFDDHEGHRAATVGRIVADEVKQGIFTAISDEESSNPVEAHAAAVIAGMHGELAEGGAGQSTGDGSEPSPDQQARLVSVEEVLAAQAEVFGRAVDEYLVTRDGPIDISPEARTQLIELMAWRLRREAILDTDEAPTGLVFAGIGTNELHPVLESYRIQGVIGGEVKAVRDDDTCSRIEPGRPAAVVPLAQSDPIRGFMEGIDPLVARVLSQMMKKLGDVLPNKAVGLLSSHGQPLDPKVAQQLRTLVSQTMNNALVPLEKARHKQFRPILETIALLPKADLAAVAESLVSLAALRLRVSPSDETVGGPVDVAVISKTDGFVWVRRKLYFSMDLNPDFER